jgi:hypothetical protein
VRARFIVLDACLTGSLISVFAPLLTNDGRIICSMTSTPRTIVGPGTWTQLIQAIDSQEKNGVARVLAQSANDVQQSVGCGVFGVFDGSSRTLTFDEHVGMPDPTLDSKTTLGREQEVGQITSQTQQSGFQTDPKRNFNYSQALAPTPSSRVYLFLTLGIAIVVGVAGVILRFL